MDKNNKRFVLGIVLLFINQPIGWGGMLLFNYLAVKYHKPIFSILGFVIYGITWGMLFLGGYLAGKEGISLVKKFWAKTGNTILSPFKRIFKKAKDDEV